MFVMKKNQLSCIEVRWTLYAFMMVSVIASGIGLIYFGMEGVKFLTWNGIRGGLTPDLFESIWHSACENPYKEEAIYPPLIYLIVRIFLPLMTEPFPLYNRWTEIVELSHSFDAVILFSVYSLITFCGLFFLIKMAFKGALWEKILIFIFFIASSPFIYMYERGNTVAFSLFFFGVYIFNLYSQKKSIREFSYICFAVASCIKIYPVITGVLILFRAGWKAVIRAIIYTLVLFFLPFSFTGGISSLGDLIYNILYLSSETTVDTRDFGYGFKVNISSVCNAIFYLLDIENGTDVFIFIMMILIIGGLGATIFLSKKYSYKVLAFSLIMIMLPPFSWIYNVVYLFIPFLLILRQDNFSWLDFCMLLLIFGALVPLPYGNVIDQFGGINPLTLSTFVCVACIYVLAIVLTGSSIFYRVVEFKRRKYYDNRI